MNAILLALLALEVGAVTDTIGERTYKYSADGGATKDVKYRLLTPEKVEPGKKLILFLHGAGERGSDNAAQLKYFPTRMAEPKMRAEFPCYLIALSARPNEKWVDSPWDKAHSQPLPKEPSEPMKMAIAILNDVIKNEAVDPDRVYLTGLSMGGYGTWDLAARMPDKFAAAVPICGGGDDKQAEKLAKLPIWCWHGDADPAVPIQRSREMIEAIKKAGGHPKYTELPGVGHDSWTKAYSEGAIPWMFERRREQAK